jgi:hypothetical protein
VQEAAFRSFFEGEAQVSTNQQRDADIDRLLRAALKPAADSHAGECPDASLLAAFVEGGLSKEERAALDAHIVECGRCQEALAIIGREAPGPEAAPARSEWFTWVTRPRLRWLVPITALATVAVFFFATRPLIAPGDSPEPGEVTQFARATPPAGQAVEAPSAAAAPAKGMAGNELKDKLAATRAAGKLAEPERRLARDQRPADQAAVPAQVAEAVPAPSAAPVGQAALERKDAAAGAGNVAARADVDEKRTKPAAEPAALPPAPVPPPAEAQFAAKSAVTPRAVTADAGRPTAASVQKRTEPRSEEAALSVVAAPGGAIRWRLGRGGQIWQSAGAGETWRLQVSGTAADLLAGSAPSPTTCWVVGAGGTVLLTLDGEHWARRPFPFPVDLTGVRATDARAATVVAADGRRFATLDAGLTWK